MALTGEPGASSSPRRRLDRSLDGSVKLSIRRLLTSDGHSVDTVQRQRGLSCARRPEPCRGQRARFQEGSRQSGRLRIRSVCRRRLTVTHQDASE